MILNGVKFVTIISKSKADIIEQYILNWGTYLAPIMSFCINAHLVNLLVEILNLVSSVKKYDNIYRYLALLTLLYSFLAAS